MHNTLTDIPGISVGHWTNLEAGTGCTVILCPEGAVAGVDVRGGAPGTRDIALLDPTCKVERVNAVMLSGGSAFGLAAADGAMRWLEERGYGYDVGVAKVPIVPSAILFDLMTGYSDVRPDSAAGYAACQAATSGAIATGNVGAGTGAAVGKMRGMKWAMKSGIGTASKQIGNGGVIAALVAVNAVGDVIDPQTQQIIAGARNAEGGFVDSMKIVEEQLAQGLGSGSGSTPESSLTNTTIAVVATNIKLTKAQATKVAQMAHDGLARTIRPIHTLSDGDAIFALSLGEYGGDVSWVGAIAADVLGEAVVGAVWAAEGAYGLMGGRDEK